MTRCILAARPIPRANKQAIAKLLSRNRTDNFTWCTGLVASSYGVVCPRCFPIASCGMSDALAAFQHFCWRESKNSSPTQANGNLKMSQARVDYSKNHDTSGRRVSRKLLSVGRRCPCNESYRTPYWRTYASLAPTVVNRRNDSSVAYVSKVQFYGISWRSVNPSWLTQSSSPFYNSYFAVPKSLTMLLAVWQVLMEASP